MPFERWWILKDTVAIIGSHPRTRGNFDFNRDDADVWVFNEALRTPWCKRADAVFQMHSPVIWRSTTNRNDPNHYEWLKATDIPVYMQDKYDDVPASIKFPIEDIIADLFGEYKPIPYITSSVGYALALAVYLKYKRIEVYGVEMETNTEYGHQRIGVAFWIGIAIGRGIDIDFHSDSILNAPLYGYEGTARIDKEKFEKRIDELKEVTVKFKRQFEEAESALLELLAKFEADYKAGLPDIDLKIQAVGQRAYNFGMADGAIQANELYLRKSIQQEVETGNYMIVRQEFEGGSIDAQKQYQFAMIKVYDVAKHMRACVNKLKECTNRYERRNVSDHLKKIVDAYTKATTHVGMASGITMENKQWMGMLDQLGVAAGGQEALKLMTENLMGNVPVELQ